MDIDHCGIERFMSEKLLNDREFDPLLIEMSSECVTEAMRSKAPFPTELFLLLMDMIAYPVGTHGFLMISGIRKEIAHRFMIDFPILGERIQRCLR